MDSPEMQYRPLGKCGTKVSLFGLGGWTTFGHSVTDKNDVSRIIHRAFDAGINFFDIADIYARGKAEKTMGNVLEDFPRHELVITTKVFWPMSDAVNDRGLSRKHIMESIDKSLKRIGTDYLDIYFCHRFDPDTPLEETARAMDDLIHQGKILYWGTSEWSGRQLREVANLCDSSNLYRPQIEQPQFSLLARGKFENNVRPAADELGMGLVTWSPLMSGLLTGKYDQGVPEGTRLADIDWLREDVMTEERLARVRKFKALADRLGYSRAQIALAWTAAQPGVSSVILGATRLDQLQENLTALSINITPEFTAELNEIFPVDGPKKDTE